MKAKVIKPFRGVKDGEIMPIDFAVGDEVEGDLAQVALDKKWAKPVRQRKSKPPEDGDQGDGDQTQS